MDGALTREQLKDWGAGRPAPPEVVALYRAAFADYGISALWSFRADIAAPSITQALTIADGLRMEGDLRARALAERIEQACRAAV